MALLCCLTALLASFPVAAGERQADLQATSAQGSTLRIFSAVSPIRINTLHAWQLQLSDASGAAITDATISVTGGMPEHDHGMPTQPVVTGSPAAGSYTLQGLRFHMPGAWEVEFLIEHDGVQETLLVAFEL